MSGHLDATVESDLFETVTECVNPMYSTANKENHTSEIKTMKRTDQEAGRLLPATSSEWILRVTRPLGKLVMLMLLIGIIESQWGHPAIRLTWVGGDKPYNMRRCVILTILGERHDHRGYRSLLTMEKPERSVATRLWNLVAREWPARERALHSND